MHITQHHCAVDEHIVIRKCSFYHPLPCYKLLTLLPDWYPTMIALKNLP
ncbi:hypothetical protein EPHNCH_0876 [Anaplasma phagocytophilum str. NCH-1]|uniref:Uncharacterized protein n=1 Tax=Anaplasma phagocytophilum str. NCH-1 TaxID=1359161 RepID=A0A0F3NEA1_ANAPH|nr:hypothetical protein EPHNCH_0876 [Anaplasma phagocytophilum str. NCH-1]